MFFSNLADIFISSAFAEAVCIFIDAGRKVIEHIDVLSFKYAFKSFTLAEGVLLFGGGVVERTIVYVL